MWVTHYFYIAFTRYLRYTYNIITRILRKHWAASGLRPKQNLSAVVDETWWWSLSSFSSVIYTYTHMCCILPKTYLNWLPILLYVPLSSSTRSILFSSFSILPSGITSTSNGGTKAKTLFDHLFFYFQLYFWSVISIIIVTAVTVPLYE